ncbi:MAG: hypothetical protein HYW15_00020 [Candidatus Giovannonibacteria bacterium]|nr:MAG: hypothetical protein HYW15_00020 [Candidatus Giovannonibacteria bacterium]
MKRHKVKPKSEPLIRRPSIATLILKKLGEIGYGTVDAFFPAKYPEARVWREILGLDKSHGFSKQTFHSTLQRLQRQKLVAKNTKGWHITDLGKKFIHKVNYNPRPVLPPEDGVIRLIIFDIPERDRKKRLWLRIELASYGYEMLQKSVWLGRRPMPQVFFEALEALGLRGFVHIVSIGRAGTLNIS